MGVASLFLDGRGHGWSEGRFWRPAQASPSFGDAAGDVKKAVAYLRSHDAIDSARIGLIGHSDGGTEVLMAASADWEVRATVSLSASVAPWGYVNHVAPANLLLIYGAEDRFVLQHTDELLIKNATRGYLEGEGRVGSLDDGSARSLMRIPQAGHVDVLYSTAARRAALEWIAEAFGLDRIIVLSPTRVGWTVAGVVFLVAILLGWRGWPSSEALTLGAVRNPLLRAFVVAVTWLGVLGMAATQVDGLRSSIPANEGAVVIALLLAMTGLFGCLLVLVTGDSSWPPWPTPSGFTRDLGRGILVAIAFEVVFELLLRPVYEAPWNAPRFGLFALFFCFALPALGLYQVIQRWVGIRPHFAFFVDIILAIAAAAVAPQWFERMSALPVYLLACTLPVMAAYRIACVQSCLAGTAAFGAFLFARWLSFVCALY